MRPAPLPGIPEGGFLYCPICKGRLFAEDFTYHEYYNHALSWRHGFIQVDRVRYRYSLGPDGLYWPSFPDVAPDEALFCVPPPRRFAKDDEDMCFTYDWLLHVYDRLEAAFRTYLAGRLFQQERLNGALSQWLKRLLSDKEALALYKLIYTTVAGEEIIRNPRVEIAMTQLAELLDLPMFWEAEYWSA